MTMQAVAAFATAISEDEALRAALKSAVGPATGPAAYAATAAFATDHGYAVTADEVERGYQALQGEEAGHGGELSDAELEIVAGGKGTSSVIREVKNEVKPIANEVKGFFKGLFG